MSAYNRICPVLGCKEPREWTLEKDRDSNIAIRAYGPDIAPGESVRVREMTPQDARGEGRDV